MISLGLRRIDKQLLNRIETLIESEQWCRYYNAQSCYQDGMVVQLESWAKSMLDRRYALATTSGTQALTMALSALDVKGKEVIVSAYSFVACAISIICAGATPIIAPINKRLSLDPEILPSLITDKTAAIMVVHMRGIVNDVSAISTIAKANNCALLEDCSQFDGLSVNGQINSSSLTDICIFSFQAKKLLSAGEGGMIATNDAHLYKKLFMLHDPVWFMRQNLPFIQTEDYYPLTPGSRMNEVTAAILLEQANGFSEFLETLRICKKSFVERLADKVPLLSDAPPNCVDGGTVIIQAENADEANTWRHRLHNIGFSIYPESAKVHDPHFYIGWPHHIKQQVRTPVDLTLSKQILSNSIMLQTDPDWTNDEIIHWTEQLVVSLSV